jgi:hypothetical protein
LPDCPHCSKPIEQLSGFISEEKHVERIKNVTTAKQTEIDQFAIKIAELTPQAQGHAALVADRDAWQGKYEQRVQRDERAGLLTGLSIDAAKLEGFESLWSSSQAGKAEADRADFSSWLSGDAQAHPLLAGMFSATTPATPETTTTTETPAPSGLPTTPGPVAAPEAPQGKESPAQVSAYFNSPAYKALSAEDQRAKLAEKRAEAQA